MISIKRLLFTILLTSHVSLLTSHVYAKEITIIGDSITVGASKYIKYYIPNAVIDAKVGRKFQEAMDRVIDLERKGLLKDTVIIALGTNGYFSVEEGLRLIDYLQSRGRQVIFVNVKVPRKWENHVNATYLELARLRPSIKVLNWNYLGHMCLSMHMQCFRDDGYHLTNIGSDLFARMIYWYGYRY
jgi:hypothetical protein